MGRVRGWREQVGCVRGWRGGVCGVRGWRSVDGSPKGSGPSVKGRRGNVKRWRSTSRRGFRRKGRLRRQKYP